MTPTTPNWPNSALVRTTAIEREKRNGAHTSRARPGQATQGGLGVFPRSGKTGVLAGLVVADQLLP